MTFQNELKTHRLTITTNNQPRDILHWHDLSDKERDDLDYLDTEERKEQASFFRYKGEIYHIEDSMTTYGTELYDYGWQGVYSDSFFSGVVFKYPDGWNYDQVIVGRFYSGSN